MSQKPEPEPVLEIKKKGLRKAELIKKDYEWEKPDWAKTKPSHLLKTTETGEHLKEGEDIGLKLETPPDVARWLARLVIPLRRERWSRAVRIIPSLFPPAGLFDEVADPDDLDAVFAVEALTNPRLRDAVGDLSLVPDGERFVRFRRQSAQ